VSSSDTLTFRLVPKGQTLNLEKFIRGLTLIQRMLTEVDYAVTRKTAGRWTVKKLQSSAPTITLQAPPKSIPAVPIFKAGIRELATNKRLTAPPASFTEKALRDLADTRHLFAGRQGMRELEIESGGEEVATVQPDTIDRVQSILLGGYYMLGSIEGSLERINWHGRHNFTVWDRVSGAPVTVSFSEAQEGLVLAHAKERVLVSGRIRYFANGVPRSITELDDITPLPYDFPKELAAFGSIPDLTDGVDSVEFVKALR
jgi:hypothetical protein